MSFATRFQADVLDLASLDKLYGVVAGNLLAGVGLLILFRHRAGLGGFNVLALYLQENFGIRAGYFQLAVDVAKLTRLPFAFPEMAVVEHKARVAGCDEVFGVPVEAHFLDGAQAVPQDDRRPRTGSFGLVEPRGYQIVA